jgi:peptidoglycan/LPS O-acetylase OafA/YrhL
MAARLSRDQSLDTVRGLAILFVLLGHFLHAAPFAIGGVAVATFVRDFGHGGVLLFFLLSGYLIWTTAQRAPAPVFLIRRFGKIAPAYWVNVLFVALMGALVPIFPAFGWKDILGNIAFLEGSLGVAPMSGVYWTLIVEVKFYVLFALLFYSPLRPLFWLAPFAAVAANIGAFAMLGRSSTFLTYLPAFFIGAAIAAHESKAVAGWLVAAVALATMLNLGFAAAHRGPAAALFLAFDIAVFLLARRSGFALGWLAWLGVVSYSVYLYHMTLGQPLLETFGPTAGALWPPLLAAVTAAMLAVSWLSWRYVEGPGVAAARRLEPTE